MLGILEDQQLSDHGKRSLTTGLEPRLANMLIRGIDAGFGQSASTLAAFLQEPALLRQGDDIERLMQQAMDLLAGKAASRPWPSA